MDEILRPIPQYERYYTDAFGSIYARSIDFKSWRS